jgi:hypothetical protein
MLGGALAPAHAQGTCQLPGFTNEWGQNNRWRAPWWPDPCAEPPRHESAQTHRFHHRFTAFPPKSWGIKERQGGPRARD